MKRLVFIVEGDCELILIQQHLIPYLYGLGYTNPMNAQTIITNRKQHKKGGVINYDYLKNDVERVLAQGNVIITTFIDFFKLPPSFPNYTTDSLLINKIEEGILDNFNNNSDIIPYIQRHELESLMFSKIDGFEIVIDEDDKLDKIQQIINDYPNPEDINSRPHLAPSKRLHDIFGYEKVADSEMILEMLDIPSIMDKCPRFKIWIEKLIIKLDEGL